MHRFSNVQALKYVIILSLLIGCRASYAQEYSASKASDELINAVQKYSSCSKTCAQDLAKMIFSSTVTSTLGAFGAMKSTESDNPKAIKILVWTAFAQHLYNTGAKTISENAACYQSCDQLHSDIVKLGSSGLLGPMLRSESVNLELMESGELFQLYLKYIQPIEVPAEHRGEEWWKYISNTG